MLEATSLAYSVTRKGQEPLPILEQVSFLVPGGHLLAVIGPTASGKSTVLRVLAGLTQPASGTLTLRGRDLLERPLQANELGWVPAQDDCLHEQLTVRENLMSALVASRGIRSWRRSRISSCSWGWKTSPASMSPH
jgi:ABC transport system ATP-binding/permease protein